MEKVKEQPETAEEEAADSSGHRPKAVATSSSFDIDGTTLTVIGNADKEERGFEAEAGVLQVDRRSSWPLAELRQPREPGGVQKQLSLTFHEEDYEPPPGNVDVVQRYVMSRPSSVTWSSQHRVASRRSSYDYVAPDGGWGWVVVLGAFVDYFLVMGLTRSFGVIYGELHEAFPTSTHSQVAAVPSIVSALVTGLAILAGALSKRFSCKSVAFFGGLICASSICMCYFAMSLVFLTVAFIFAGIGAALTTIPGILTIAVYFKKRRALATGLCLSGSAIGAMVQPPLLQMLSRRIGFRAALLIIGLLMYSTCISALSFNDPRKDFERAKRRSSQEIQVTVLSPLDSLGSRSSVFLDDEVPTLLDTPSTPPPAIPRPTSSQHGSPRRSREQAGGDTSNAINFVAYDSMHFETKQDGLPLPGETEAEPETRSTDDEDDASQRRPSRDSHQLQVYRSPIYVAGTEQGRRSHTSLRRSSSSLLLLEFRNQAEARYSILERSPKNKFVLWVKKNLYVDIIFLKNPVFLVVLFSTALIMAAYPTGLIFIPIYSESQGIEETRGSLLLSIAAIGDLLGRIVCGWFLDRNVIKHHYVLISARIMVSVSFLQIGLTSIYWVMAVCVCFYGISGGFCVLTLPILLADHHGADTLSSTFGLARFGQAIVGLAVPPIAGYLRDVTGEFMYCFVFMGTTALLGAIITFAVPYTKGRYRRKVERQITASRSKRLRRRRSS